MTTEDDRFTDAVRSLLAVAEEIRTQRADSDLLARHVAEAFVRRHRGMLERLWPASELEAIAAGRARDGGTAGAVLGEAVDAAARQGDERADLRHLATALAQRLEIAPTGAAPSVPGKRATPTLDRFGRDLVQLAQRGLLTPVIGRDNELGQLVEILCRRLRRNPLLVGPAGVGKTAIVEALALRVAGGALPEALRGLRIVELTPTALAAAAPSLSELSSLVQTIAAEASQPEIVLFVDELQGLVVLGGAELGALAQLKPALARGDLACIGALTEGDYYRLIQPDSALDRRFQPIRVEETTPAETRDILRAVGPRLVEGTDVEVTDEVIEETVVLAAAYLRNRYFPDKALDVLDRAAARAALKQVRLDRELVADVVSDMTGFSVGREDVVLKIDGLKEFLRTRVIGQDEAIDVVVEQLMLKVRGLDLRPSRPNGVFLFTGPTGVGKTELARALAEHLFGSADRMIRLDMSEFTESHYVARILGSPPGYVGYGEPVALLDDISSRPFSVVLLDEIEKAHPQVHRLFLQVFEDGFLTSGTGRRVYFSDAIIIMTANLDLKVRRRPGFGAQEEEVQLEALERYFAREFVNRIDEICVFRSLGPEDVGQIVRKMLRGWLEEQRRHGLEIDVTEEAVATLAELGYSPEFGAREVSRVIERELLEPLVDLVRGERSSLIATAEAGRIRLSEKEE